MKTVTPVYVWAVHKGLSEYLRSQLFCEFSFIMVILLWYSIRLKKKNSNHWLIIFLWHQQVLSHNGASWVRKQSERMKSSHVQEGSTGTVCEYITSCVYILIGVIYLYNYQLDDVHMLPVWDKKDRVPTVKESPSCRFQIFFVIAKCCYSRSFAKHFYRKWHTEIMFSWGEWLIREIYIFIFM